MPNYKVQRLAKQYAIANIDETNAYDAALHIAEGVEIRTKA